MEKAKDLIMFCLLEYDKTNMLKNVKKMNNHKNIILKIGAQCWLPIWDYFRNHYKQKIKICY